MKWTEKPTICACCGLHKTLPRTVHLSPGGPPTLRITLLPMYMRPKEPNKYKPRVERRYGRLLAEISFVCRMRLQQNESIVLIASNLSVSVIVTLNDTFYLSTIA